MAENTDTDAAISPRQTFGKGGKAWLEVVVSRDRQRAFLNAMCLSGDMTVELVDMLDAFRDQYLIRVEINRDGLADLLQRALEKPRQVVRDTCLIAQGVPPGKGADGWVQYTFQDHIVKQTRLPYQELKTAFEEQTPKEVIGWDLQTRMAVPEEELAVRIAPTEGSPGQDVFGQVQKDTPYDRAVSLKPGDHVSTRGDHFSIQGERFVSEAYGYVCLLEDTLSVLSPIWIAPDKFVAYFIYFPQVGAQRLPDAAWLDWLLEAQGVQKGVDRAWLDRLWQDLVDRRDPGFFPVARGQPPVAGEDTRIELTFDPKKRAGEVLEDGSIDLRERHSVVAVKSGQLLAELFPAKPGQPGFDVMGNAYAARPGRRRSLKAGKDVLAERREDGSQAFYARMDGQVWVRGDTIHVHEVLRIQGDVGYDMGNVEAGKDVHIMGSIQSGFKVRAAGNISIAGVAEPGSSIHAEGDVIVSGGILGETTRVVAMGDVLTRFIQNSTVMARGDVVVGSYVFNGKVRSGGQVVVNGRGQSRRAGSIVGGQVLATTGITTRLVGSSSAEQTVVGIESDLEIKMRLDKLRETVAFSNTSLMRMFRALGLRELDAESIRELIKRTPAHRRRQVAVLLRKMKELMILKEISLKAQQDLESKMEQTLTEAEIVVTGRMYSDVQVRFGELTHRVTEEIQRPRFFLTEEGIERR